MQLAMETFAVIGLILLGYQRLIGGKWAGRIGFWTLALAGVILLFQVISRF